MEIHYAKTAKKMDMKKLKQSMWHLLTEFSTQADTEVTEVTRLHLPSRCSTWGRGGESPVLTDPRPRANAEGGTQKWEPSHLKEVN